MAVITISRQFGSHGDTVGQLLCDRLGYRYFDKNLMSGLSVFAWRRLVAIGGPAPETPVPVA